MKQLKRIILSTIAVVAIMLLSICLLSKLDFLPGMSVSAMAETYDYYVKIVDNRGGKVTVTSGNSSVTTVTSEAGFYYVQEYSIITVEPDENFRLFDIRIFQNGSETDPKNILTKQNDNTYKLYVSRFCNYEVRVTFVSINEHSITIHNDNTCGYYESKVKRDGSVIDTDNESPKAKEGDIIEIKFVPNKKYTISNIVINLIADRTVEYDESTDTYTLTFTMKDLHNVTVSPRYENKKYNINIVSTEHGTITITDNNTNPKWGQTITLNVTPENGYRISSLTVMAGSTQITVTDNQFTMPESDVTVTAEFEKINTIQECDIRDWNYLKENADPSIATVTTENGVTTVKLNSCIIISSEFEIDDENVVLDLNGYGIRGAYEKHENNENLVLSFNCIRVKAGNKLTITDTYKESDREYYITLDNNGRGYSVTNEGTESETCIKVTGGYITGLYSSDGGSIVLECDSKEGSDLTIEDGTLIGNYCDKECGVVKVQDNCFFMMNGGSIINNKTYSSTGVYVVTGGTFIMNGGDISGNTAEDYGSGVSVYGGTFIMNGGTVSGNTAGDHGGGVYVSDGTFIMTNGTISGNTATTGANIYTYSNGGEYIGKFYRLPGITVTDTDKSNGSVEKVIGKITTSDTENGSITISADDSVTVGETVYYPDGSTVTVTAAPAKGYTVKSIKYDDTVITPVDGVYSFIMPAGDVTVTAEFELSDYTITKSNAHGTVTTKVNDADSDTAHYGDTVTITATPDEGYGLITFAVRDVDGNLIPVIDNTFTMPASNITVTAVFAEPKEPVAYIDADGTQKTVEYYTVLDESQTELTEGWYVINSKNLTVENTLKPSGDVNIILVDGCFMNVNTGTYSLECETYTNLCIYGQNKGTGEMFLYSHASGTSVKINGSLTINGGIWESLRTNISGTDSTKDCFTINDGNIRMKAFYNDAPLEIKGGKCSINGGKVELQCDYDNSWSIKSDCGITLGYKKGSDYIKFNKSLSNSTVTIASGKKLTDGTNEYSGDVAPSELSGKTLVPVKFTVAVTPKDTNGTEISVQGIWLKEYIYGAEVTLTAPAKEGYNFSGWYEGATEKCKTNSYTFTITENKDLTAVYEPLGKAELIIKGGDSFTINSETYNTILTKEYQLGSKITVETNGDKFAYWQNKYGMVLSRSKSYTYTVTGADEITAVFDTVDENKVNLVFESAYGQVMAREQLATGGTMNLPSLPFYNGYEVRGWDLNGNGVYDPEPANPDPDVEYDTIAVAIKRGLEAESKKIVIKPIYVLKPNTFTINVVNGNGGGSFKQNDKVTVVADTPAANMKFSHWTDGTNILCYNSRFTFFADRNLTLTAVYVAENDVVKAKAMTEIIQKYSEGNNLVFVSLSTVPEGFKIVKAGVILTNDADIVNKDKFDDKNATYIFGDAWSGTTYRYTLTKSNVANGDTWYARGYLIYTDKDGNTDTIYSAVESQTYSGN